MTKKMITILIIALCYIVQSLSMQPQAWDYHENCYRSYHERQSRPSKQQENDTKRYYQLPAGHREIQHNLDLELIHAAEKGDLEAIKRALKKGAYISPATTNGFTALHAAAKYGHSNVVPYLFEQSKFFGFAQPSQETPLHCAAESGNIDIVKLFLINGALPYLNFPNCNRETPLQIAARNNNYALMRVLIQHGAWTKSHELEKAFTGQKESLQYMAAVGKLDRVKTILEAQTHTEDDENDALLYAISLGHFEVVDFLLRTTFLGHPVPDDAQFTLQSTLERANLYNEKCDHYEALTNYKLISEALTNHRKSLLKPIQSLNSTLTSVPHEQTPILPKSENAEPKTEEPQQNNIREQLVAAQPIIDQNNSQNNDTHSESCCDVIKRLLCCCCPSSW